MSVSRDRVTRPVVALVLACCIVPSNGEAQGAPEIVGASSVSTGNVFRGTLTPDGDTLYFFKNVTENQEDYRIFRSTRRGDRWSDPERMTFGGDHSDLYPAISPDGRRMVLSSYRPAPGDDSGHPSAYLWVVQRENGRWGDPTFMAEASRFGYYHAQPTFTQDGDLYFIRSTWNCRRDGEYVTRWRDGRYVAPDTSAAWRYWRDHLEDDQNLYETTPGYDGTYVLLVIGTRNATTGRAGPPDLWYARGSGEDWTAPRRLAGGVNTDEAENFAFFGSQGRDLFFVRAFNAIYRIPVARAMAR